MTCNMMPDRRAAVKALSGMGLTFGGAGLANGRTAAAVSDADLIALREPIERLAALERAAAAAMVDAFEARDALRDRLTPKALLFTPSDGPLLPRSVTGTARRWTAVDPVYPRYVETQVDKMREQLRAEDERVQAGRPSLPPGALDRMRQIVNAEDCLGRQVEASPEHMHAEEQERRHREIARELNALIERATTCRATTIAGLQVKLAAVAACVSETVLSYVEGWQNDPEMASLLKDIVAMHAVA